MGKKLSKELGGKVTRVAQEQWERGSGFSHRKALQVDAAACVASALPQ